MADGGRHRSDRPAGVPGWATVLGLVLLALAVAAAVLLAAVPLLPG